MSKRAWANKRDGNERLIVDGLRSLGYFVERVDGTDIPDLLVCKHGRTVLVEVKDPANYGKVLDGQQAWHDEYARYGGDVIVAETLEDVLKHYGDM